MARVRDARATRAGSHAEVMHQAGASTARGSVLQGSGMGVTGRRDVARGWDTRRGRATDTAGGRAGPRAVEYVCLSDWVLKNTIVYHMISHA
eukprot:1100358-Prymnesium_polylepis.1